MYSLVIYVCVHVWNDWANFSDQTSASVNLSSRIMEKLFDKGIWSCTTKLYSIYSDWLKM